MEFEKFERFLKVLDDLCESEEITLKELAQRIGVAEPMLYSYKNQRYYPKIKTAVKIADYFHVPLNYLFGVDNYADYENFNEVNIALFYPRYKELLNKHKTSHYRLYKTRGLSRSSITDWKNGSEPEIQNLIIIADALNTTIDYLIGRTDIA